MNRQRKWIAAFLGFAALGWALSYVPDFLSVKSASQPARPAIREIPLAKEDHPEDVAQPPAEEHESQAPILLAAEDFGEMDARIQRELDSSEDPGERAQAVQKGAAAFKECALSGGRPDSIRALCYARYFQIKPDASPSELPVSERIRMLAREDL